jgi:hypothetical protein
MANKNRFACAKKDNFEVDEAIGIPIEPVTKPYPLGKRVSLSRHCSEIADEWFHKKNCGFTPDDFSYGSGVNVW